MAGLLLYLLVDFGIQAVLGGVAIFLHTDKFFDLAGSLTFVLLAILSYRGATPASTRQLLHTAAVVVCRLYLALFLFYRIHVFDGDKRLAKIMGNPVRFFVVWMIQGLWVFLTMLPSLLVNTSKRSAGIGSLDMIGLGMFVFGFLFEVVADLQKFTFKLDSANQGKFIQSGLWALSRHPNYLGEIVLWTGLYISALPVLRGWSHLAVLSPMFVAFLLIRVSGIPILERNADKRWGELAEYQSYKENTAVLVPYVY